MKIRKFNNGNINMSLEKSDFFYYQQGTTDSIDIDAIYNNEITMDDLYFNQINGYSYLVDFNTSCVYDISNQYINVLIELKQLLLTSYNENMVLKLYALDKKECKSLLQDLENGY